MPGSTVSLGEAGVGLTRGVREVEEINADEGVRWVFSFLTADKRKTYCLYEASSPDAILAAARRAGLPADSIVEVERVEAAMFTERHRRQRRWCPRSPETRAEARVDCRWPMNRSYV